MFWADIRCPQRVEINCALIKYMLDELNPDAMQDFEDEYVETLTRRIESCITIDISRGKPVTIWRVFLLCLED